jgi:hypothetical protein
MAKVANRSFANKTQFRYFRRTAKDHNLIPGESRRILNLGIACYRSVQYLLSSHLLTKNAKIVVYKTIILTLVLYGGETLCITVREKQRLGCLRTGS